MVFYIIMGILCVAYVYCSIQDIRNCDKCHECGGKVVEIGNNYTPECWLFGGFDSFFKCQKCGKIYKVHHYTYD